jgi:Iap family predicted aminopeptidase
MENLKLTLKDLELIDYALECQIADNKESVQNRIWKIQDRITKIQNENTKRKTQHIEDSFEAYIKILTKK